MKISALLGVFSYGGKSYADAQKDEEIKRLSARLRAEAIGVKRAIYLRTQLMDEMIEGRRPTRQ